MAKSDQPKFSNITEFENYLRSAIPTNVTDHEAESNEELLESDGPDLNIPNIIDIDQLLEIRRNFLNNALIGYLNINTLKNKIADLRPIVQDLNFTFLAIAETKLNDSIKSAQFRIDVYYCPEEFRRDRLYNAGGGILIYIKKGIP